MHFIPESNRNIINIKNKSLENDTFTCYSDTFIFVILPLIYLKP